MRIMKADKCTAASKSDVAEVEILSRRWFGA